MSIIWISGNNKRAVFMKAIYRCYILHLYTYIRDSYSGKITKSYTCLTDIDVMEIANMVKEAVSK